MGCILNFESIWNFQICFCTVFCLRTNINKWIEIVSFLYVCAYSLLVAGFLMVGGWFISQKSLYILVDIWSISNCKYLIKFKLRWCEISWKLYQFSVLDLCLRNWQISLALFFLFFWNLLLLFIVLLWRESFYRFNPFFCTCISSSCILVFFFLSLSNLIFIFQFICNKQLLLFLFLGKLDPFDPALAFSFNLSIGT